MTKIEIEGIVKEYPPMVSGQGQNGPWYKQTVVIEQGGQYPKMIALNVWNDKINELNAYPPGTYVKFTCNAESKKGDKGWYNPELSVYKFELASQTMSQPNQPAQPPSFNPPAPMPAQQQPMQQPPQYQQPNQQPAQPQFGGQPAVGGGSVF